MTSYRDVGVYSIERAAAADEGAGEFVDAGRRQSEAVVVAREEPLQRLDLGLERAQTRHRPDGPTAPPPHRPVALSPSRPVSCHPATLSKGDTGALAHLHTGALAHSRTRHSRTVTPAHSHTTTQPHSTWWGAQCSAQPTPARLSIPAINLYNRLDAPRANST